MIKVTDTESFIQKARIIHGDKYDYSKTVYVNSTIKVLITCNNHGDYHQSPGNHLSGKGCPKCRADKARIRYRMPLSEFIEKATIVHGGKYDYSLVDYVNNNTKIKIICKKHGIFNQSPSKHLIGRGCRKCGILKQSKSSLLTLDEFIEKARKVHGNRYSYENTQYKRYSKKINIKCKKHGLFSQTPNSHISGAGCPFCGREKSSKNNSEKSAGWGATDWSRAAERSKYFDSFKVYIIKCWNDNEVFYKIGRTFLKTNRRFRSKSSMPYDYEIIKEIIFNNARDAHNKETELKRLNKEFKYIPKTKFEGMYECFYILKNEQ